MNNKTQKTTVMKVRNKKRIFSQHYYLNFCSENTSQVVNQEKITTYRNIEKLKKWNYCYL